MQEDMRLAVPAKVQVDRVHIHILPHRGAPEWEAVVAVCRPLPGEPLRLYLEDLKDHIEGWAPKPAPARMTVVDAPPGVCDDLLRGLMPTGPVYTVDVVDGRVKVFRDGEPAPADDPWQQMADAQQAEADRVMVRAVSPAYPGPDDDRDTWVLDPGATGHRAPFVAGDFVIETGGYTGIHQVVAVSVDPDAPRHRSLRLTVKRADPVVDRDAF